MKWRQIMQTYYIFTSAYVNHDRQTENVSRTPAKAVITFDCSEFLLLLCFSLYSALLEMTCQHFKNIYLLRASSGKWKFSVFFFVQINRLVVGSGCSCEFHRINKTFCSVKTPFRSFSSFVWCVCVSHKIVHVSPIEN